MVRPTRNRADCIAEDGEALWEVALTDIALPLERHRRVHLVKQIECEPSFSDCLFEAAIA